MTESTALAKYKTRQEVKAVKAAQTADLIKSLANNPVVELGLAMVLAQALHEYERWQDLQSLAKYGGIDPSTHMDLDNVVKKFAPWIILIQQLSPHADVLIPAAARVTASSVDAVGSIVKSVAAPISGLLALAIPK